MLSLRIAILGARKTRVEVDQVSEDAIECVIEEIVLWCASRGELNLSARCLT